MCQGHGVYLGLPTFSLRSKRLQFNSKIGWPRELINGGFKQFLESGREVLIKAVLEAIPTYAMFCFRIPTSICNDIERMSTNFWWGMKSDGNKLHWCT